MSDTQFEEYTLDITGDDDYVGVQSTTFDSPYASKPVVTRNVAHDTLQLQTFLLPDTTATVYGEPVRVLEARESGVAGCVTITNATAVGTASRVLLLSSEGMHSFPPPVDSVGIPYAPFGYTLNPGESLRLTTGAVLWAVSVSAAVGVGSLLTLAVENFFA